MDELRVIISSLCKSDYLPEWILRLKDDEILFSPEKNIKSCIKTKENSVISSDWQGLCLFETYCEKNFSNLEVDAFILSILKKSVSIYVADRENDPYERLNSSHVILDRLLHIILSKPSFVDGIDFKGFVRIYLEGATSWPYHLVHQLFNAKEVLKRADQKRVFYAYKTICEQKTKQEDYEHYLFVEDLVLRNPYDYFNYSKEHVLKECLNKWFFDLGSFYEYKGKRFFNKDDLCFQWLKASSLGLDSDTLSETIKAFITDKSKLLNKIGLCLINLNFDRVKQLFFDNLNLFFSKRTFYSDLRCVLNKWGAQIFASEKTKELLNSLETATFGLEKDSTLFKLKNNLSGIYRSNGLNVPYYKEEEDDLTLITNFNKDSYSVPVNRTDEVAKIQKIFDKKDINEAVSVFSELSKGSSFFKSFLFEAFSGYILKTFPNSFADCLDLLGPGFSKSLLYQLASDVNGSTDQLFLATKKVIELIGSKADFSECISAALYATDSLSKSVDIKTLRDIVVSIDYTKIPVEENGDIGDIIDVCINEDLHLYLELCLHLAQSDGDLTLVKEVIGYHIKTNNCPKLKSILAFAYPRLFSIDEEYASSLADYVFDNLMEGHNLSYPLLSISSGVSERLLDSMCVRKELPSFLSEHSKFSNNMMAQSRLYEFLFKFYIFNDKYEGYVALQFDNEKFDVVLNCIRNMVYWFESNAIGEREAERCSAYLRRFMSMIQNSSIDFDDNDQLIREVSNLILVSNDYDHNAWEILLLLFRNFKHFFSDDCLELIKKYKNSRVKEIKALLTMYFSSYEQYQFFEETLIAVFNEIATNHAYAKKAREWRTLLVSKNLDLKSKLIMPAASVK